MHGEYAYNVTLQNTFQKWQGFPNYLTRPMSANWTFYIGGLTLIPYKAKFEQKRSKTSLYHNWNVSSIISKTRI